MEVKIGVTIFMVLLPTRENRCCDIVLYRNVYIQHRGNHESASSVSTLHSAVL